MSSTLVQGLAVAAIVAGAGIYLARRVTVQWRASRRFANGSTPSAPCGCGCHDAGLSENPPQMFR